MCYEDFLNEQPCYFFGNGMPKWKNINNKNNSYYIDIDVEDKAISDISYAKYKSKSFSNIVTAAPLYTKEFYSN
jgi:hypothetical protein